MKRYLLPLFLLFAFSVAQAVVVPDRIDYRYNVKRFGAKGDGVTNDQAALQAALTAGAGTTVFLPEGIYLIDTVLRIPSKTTLLGTGRGSEIRLTSAAESFMVLNADTASGNDSGIVIDNLFFNGQQTFLNYDSVSAHGADDAVALYKVKNGEIRNCFFANTKRDAIALRTSKDCRVVNNTIWNSAEEAIATSGGAIGGHIISGNVIVGKDSTFQSAAGDKGGGILVKTPNTTITDNSITYCGTAIDINWEGQDSLYNIVVSNNNLHLVMGNGIAMLGAHHSSITGNVIYDMYGFGIVCGRKINASDTAYTQNVVIANNVIRNVRDHTGTTAEAYAIEVQWGSDYQISDNVIDSVAVYGIHTRARNTIISNNKIRLTGSHAILLQDTLFYCIVEGNRIDSAGKDNTAGKGHGIHLFGNTATAEYVTVQGNIVTNSYLSGIYADSIDNSSFVGNVLNLNNRAGNNSSGLLLAVCHDNTISGNSTFGNAYGIRSVDLGRGNVLSGNITLNSTLGTPPNDTFGIVVDTGNLIAGNAEDSAGLTRFFSSMPGRGGRDVPDSQWATLQFVRDSAGGGGGGTDTTAKYLSQDFGTGEYVTYNPTTNDLLPHANDVINIGTGILKFRDGLFAGYVEADDSVGTSTLTSLGRTWTFWFWDAVQGTDSLLLGVDTINQWLVACDGNGNCIPLTRSFFDSLYGTGGGITSDTVMSYQDKDGQGLDAPYSDIDDGVSADVLSLIANSPVFKILSSATLQLIGDAVTMVGDSTFGAGTTDIMGMLRQRLFNSGTTPDSTFWYRWVDSMANFLGDGWCPRIDSVNRRIVWQACGSGSDTVAKYIDQDGGTLDTPYGRMYDSTALDVFKLFADSPKFKITSDSILQLAGKTFTLIGDSAWGVGYIDFKSHLVFHFLDTTGTDSVFAYQLLDTMNGRLGNNWALTVDSSTGRFVFEAQVGGGGGTSDSIGVDADNNGTFESFLYPAYIQEGSNITLTVDGDTLTIASTGGGETDTLSSGAPNGTSNFSTVRDSTGTRKETRQVEEGHGVTASYGGDTSVVLAVDTTITAFQKALAKAAFDDSVVATTAKIPTAALADSSKKMDTTAANFTTYVANHAGAGGDDTGAYIDANGGSALERPYFDIFNAGALADTFALLTDSTQALLWTDSVLSMRGKQGTVVGDSGAAGGKYRVVINNTERLDIDADSIDFNLQDVLNIDSLDVTNYTDNSVDGNDIDWPGYWKSADRYAHGGAKATTDSVVLMHPAVYDTTGTLSNWRYWPVIDSCYENATGTTPLVDTFWIAYTMGRGEDRIDSLRLRLGARAGGASDTSMIDQMDLYSVDPLTGALTNDVSHTTNYTVTTSNQSTIIDITDQTTPDPGEQYLVRVIVRLFTATRIAIALEVWVDD